MKDGGGVSPGRLVALVASAHFMIGFAARSLILLAVGALADRIGLESTYLWCAALAVLGLPFVFVLPARPALAGDETSPV